MGYKALVIVEMFSASIDQQTIFQHTLIDEKWTKINSISSTWKVSFKEVVKRDYAISIITEDIRKAKKKSRIPSLNIGIQLSGEEVILESFKSGGNG